MTENTKHENTKVFKAIAAVMAALTKEGIGKEQRNLHGKYNFRGIDDVYNHLSRCLVDAKLLIVPRVVEADREAYEKEGRATMFYSSVKVAYDFISVEDGSSWSTVFVGEAFDTSDKAQNKALSAAYKMMALEVFCIPVQGTDDADSSSPEVASGSRRKPAKSAGRSKTPSKQPEAKEEDPLTADDRKRIAQIANAKTPAALDKIAQEFKEAYNGNAPPAVRAAWAEKRESLTKEKKD